jgi:hypothetical protein
MVVMDKDRFHVTNSRELAAFAYAIELFPLRVSAILDVRAWLILIMD